MAARSVPLSELVSGNFVCILEEAIAHSQDDGAFLEGCPEELVHCGLTLRRPVLRYTPFVYDRFYVDTSIPFNDYARALTSWKRNQLKRKVRKLAITAGHPLRVRVFRSGQSMKDFFQCADSIEMHRGGWSPRVFPSSLEFRRHVEMEADAGKLRAYVLFFQEIPISFLFCPLQNKALAYEYLAYHGEYSALSPGLLVLWYAIQDAFADKEIRFVDFRQGSGQQKRYFANGRIKCGDIYLLKQSGNNVVYCWAHYVLSRVAYTFELKILPLMRKCLS